MSQVKQAIVIRKDLKMKGGKLAAQACHASENFLIRHLTNKKNIVILDKATIQWISTGTKKVVLRVDSEEELLEIYKQALAAKLKVHLVKDAGHTVFKEPTITCCAIGPEYVEKFNAITGKLKLYPN